MYDFLRPSLADNYRPSAFALVLTYIDLSALAIGVSQDMAFYLVAIANASSGLGRIMAGLMADKVGK